MHKYQISYEYYSPGEHFMVIKATNKSSALITAKRILATIEAKRIPNDERKVKVETIKVVKKLQE